MTAATDIDAWLRAGHASLVDDDFAAARGHFEQARLLAEAAGLAAAEVHARAELTRLDILRNDAPGAMRHAQRCAALAGDSDDPDLKARACLAQAIVSLNLGNTSEALPLLEAALPHVEGSGDPALGLYGRILMGAALSLIKQPEAAMRFLAAARDDALRAGRKLRAVVAHANESGCWVQVGDLAAAAGQHEQARAAWQRAAQDCEAAAAEALALGCRQAQFVALGNRAEALSRLGQFDAAIDGLQQVAVLCDDAGDITGAVQVALLQAQVLQSAGKPDQARAAALAGIDRAQAVGTRRSVDQLHQLVSVLDEQRGDFASALHHHKQMFEVHKAIEADKAAQRAQVMAVRLETERARAEAARERERASALEAANAALNQRAMALSEQALQDPLTGLPNRRQLDSWLAQCHADATARHVPLCVALMDIDHFKRINDQHSHTIGDAVLRQVSALLRDQCRGDDLAARYGGEEFVFVFAGVGPQRAAVICERVRQTIADFAWEGVAPGLAVTASFGVCDIARFASPALGLAHADALMYQAKAGGRNRVCSEG